jgi:thiamine-monophosphate kinase
LKEVSIGENAFMEKMTKTLRSREDALIDRIRELAEPLGQAGVSVGIGDDAAVLEPPPPGQQILVTTDQVIENTHFTMGSHPPGPLGRKTIVRGLSDIAAMGGLPAWFALSLCVPGKLEFPWLEQFVSGMFSVIPTLAVQAFPLVGGDVARGPFFAAHVAVAGAVPRDRAMLRSAARPGDRFFVSGSLGGSALGFERLSAGAAVSDPAVARHIEPTPRLALGRHLRESGVGAALDLSDGLSTDARRLARASGVAVVLEAARIPQFPGAGLERALHGGEEYELLFAAPAAVQVPSQHQGVELTRIGRIEAGEGLWLERGGSREPLEPKGFEHFEPESG